MCLYLFYRKMLLERTKIMLSNLHTHSVFCDGANTPEEIVLAAIEKGLCSIGFSGHAYTDFDVRYCIKDTDGYMAEINRLKEKYKNEIQIYLGVEEDAYCPANKANFDYIIGSCHYYYVDGKYYPVDSNYDYFKKCLALFESDPIQMAHAYYKPFCEYICKRKPDIIGHFDLLTKFDELDTSLFLENEAYNKIAEDYIRYAAKSGCLFEVNTGAISRNYRTMPYPYTNLLQVLKKEGNGLVLTSDSHCVDTLTFGFEETKKYLKDMGFSYTYVLYNHTYEKDYL